MNVEQTLNKSTYFSLKEGKSLAVYLVLAFFGGGFGLHQFYNGKILKGFLYLLFAWTFIPGFLSIIDIIAVLILDNKKA